MQTQSETIAGLAIAIPRAIPTLEKLGIDYCCNGTRSVAEACRVAGITPDELLSMISDGEKAPGRDWNEASMTSLITFITDTHHVYTREAMDRLSFLATKVREHHGARHDWLSSVEKLVLRLPSEFIPHMLKEEQVLFPFICSVEKAVSEGKEPPLPFFGMTRNPVRMMMLEHETVAEMVREIRGLTDDYRLPEGACASYQGFYGLLQEFEADLHSHIHLENNILFPRAIDTEESNRLTPSVVGFDQCCRH